MLPGAAVTGASALMKHPPLNIFIRKTDVNRLVVSSFVVRNNLYTLKKGDFDEYIGNLTAVEMLDVVNGIRVALIPNKTQGRGPSKMIVSKRHVTTTRGTRLPRKKS